MTFKTLGLCALLALPALARTEVLASAGSETVTREDFDLAAKQQAGELKRDLSADERRALLLSMLNQRLLVAEARRRKLDREPGFKAARDEFERRALAEALYNREVASKVQLTREEVKQAYESNLGLFDVAELNQIVIIPKRGQEQAAKSKVEALAKRLQADPKSFVAVAKVESDDVQNKAKGGDLGAVRRDQMLPEMAAAAFSLKPGAVSGPVPTQFGWHILRLRSLKHLSFEKVEADLAQEMRAQKSAALQKALLESAAKGVKIKLPEGQF